MDESDIPPGIPPEVVARMRARFMPETPGTPIPEVDPDKMMDFWRVYDHESKIAYGAAAWEHSPWARYGKPLVYRCFILKVLDSTPANKVRPELAPHGERSPERKDCEGSRYVPNDVAGNGKRADTV